MSAAGEAEARRARRRAKVTEADAPGFQWRRGDREAKHERPLSVRRIDTSAPGFDAELAALIAFEAAQDPAIDATVAQIIEDVRDRGDAAVLDYTRRFDRLDAPRVAALEITPAQMHAAHTTRYRRSSATRSAPRPRASARSTSGRRARDWSVTEADGTVLGQRVTPLDSRRRLRSRAARPPIRRRC